MMRYLGLARERPMAISLASLRDELYPGLAEVANRTGRRFAVCQEFNRDVLVIKTGDQTLEIARSEIEDNRHIPKLKSFLEQLMCCKVAGNVTTVPPPPLAQEFYQAAVRDNLFLSEYNTNVTPLAEPIKPAKPCWPPAPELILD
jgi:hypothetical protein